MFWNNSPLKSALKWIAAAIATIFVIFVVVCVAMLFVYLLPTLIYWINSLIEGFQHV